MPLKQALTTIPEIEDIEKAQKNLFLVPILKKLLFEEIKTSNIQATGNPKGRMRFRVTCAAHLSHQGIIKWLKAGLLRAGQFNGSALQSIKKSLRENKDLWIEALQDTLTFIASIARLKKISPFDFFSSPKGELGENIADFIEEKHPEETVNLLDAVGPPWKIVRFKRSKTVGRHFVLACVVQLQVKVLLEEEEEEN